MKILKALLFKSMIVKIASISEQPTLFLVISMSPCLDNSDTFTIERSLSTAFFTSSYTSLLFAEGRDCYKMRNN